MWIVRIALDKPYTFIVMAILILISAPLAIQRTPVDVLPEIDIPVISVIWNYRGLSAEQMGNRIAQNHERSITTTVNDIEHIESRSLGGITIIKIYFQPKANIQTAISQVVAISQSALRQMPQGVAPPLIIKYTASSIPVIQIGMSSKTLAEKDLFDAALNILRWQGARRFSRYRSRGFTCQGYDLLGCHQCHYSSEPHAPLRLCKNR
jgi:multidrug efflux pump subunit AcrB